jgi:DMSO reductase anchor subunit
MRPAASILLFTTLAGMAQGVLVCIAVALLAGAEVSQGLALTAVGGAELLLAIALLASFFHLGQKLRAWRAVFMWRTSWMSREVLVLPALMAVTAAWWVLLSSGHRSPAAAILVIVLSYALWHCTAMIYACLRFVQEWAHPLTVVNYTLLGLSSGSIATGALAVTLGERAFAQALLPWTAALTVAAAITRVMSLMRNAGLKPRSTLQSAIGVASPRLEQKAMGMTGGSFNTREFFHGASPALFRAVKPAFLLLAFAVPLALLAAAPAIGAAAWLLAVPIQFAGLLAERWFFFAQARHPQNLYYQVVS